MAERSIAWLTRGARKIGYCGVVMKDHWRTTAPPPSIRVASLGLTRNGATWSPASTPAKGLAAPQINCEP
jgi:hypothetical protein